MTYSYDKFANIAKTQIEKYGGTVYLHIPVDGKVNSGTGQTTYSQLTIPAKAIVTGYSTQDVNDVSVLESDRQVIIDMEDGKPLVNNTITVDGVLYRILEVDEINPGVNQPIIYKLHIRNTVLAPDMDGFYTTLKGLNEGDIVVDPKSIRAYPQWIKVANDHHAQHITTLVERRPYWVQAWDSGEPFEGRWSDSDLYNYLKTTYLSKLSVELNELLSNVLIETNGYFIQSVITLLSKEELDGIATPRGSSGKQINFFNSTIRRVAVGADSLLNLNYWTRDYVSAAVASYVTSEGVLASGATTLAAAVRAMIFIQDAQIVKLNDDGETYSLVY